MSAILIPTAFTPPRAVNKDRAGTRPPSPGPVFVGDCATAADHTTLLLALWRRWDTPPED